MSSVLGSGGDTNPFRGPPQLVASFISLPRCAERRTSAIPSPRIAARVVSGRSPSAPQLRIAYCSRNAACGRRQFELFVQRGLKTFVVNEAYLSRRDRCEQCFCFCPSLLSA